MQAVNLSIFFQRYMGFYKTSLPPFTKISLPPFTKFNDYKSFIPNITKTRLKRFKLQFSKEHLIHHNNLKFQNFNRGSNLRELFLQKDEIKKKYFKICYVLNNLKIFKGFLFKKGFNQ